MNVRARIAAAVSILTVLTVSGSVHAQFSPPTCVPPNCNPEVIQNIAITGTAQSASINVTGSQKLGGTFQNGALAPVLTLATENLYYGNVGGTSTNGSLMLLQMGSADRLRVTLAGQMQLPLGSVGAPSYSFVGDTNTGFYSTGADSIGMATNGVIRTTTNNSGMTLNSGVLALPAGTNAAPSLTFTGDTNTGIFRGTADTLSFVTNGQTNMTVSATNNVVITNGLTVNGTFTSSGGLSGNGSGLTNLNASNITTGTLADARLSSNVPLLNGTQTFTGANTFSNAGNSFTGNGAGLTSLNATNISSGTLGDGRLSSNVALYNANGTFTGNNGFTGMTSFGSPTLVTGAGQNLVYGVHDTTSVGNLMLLQTENAGVYTDRFRIDADGDVTATSFTGVGTGLTALNATNLTSGTVPSARISGTYSNALTFSGLNTYSNRSSFGSATLVVAAGQALLYGNVDTTSAGNLLQLQNEGVDRFRVDAAGNLVLSGTITASGALTSGGVNVCLQNGTNCPATLGGSGTANTITKFTGGGSTVGDSQVTDDGTSIGLGGAPDASYKARVYGSLYANSVTATSVNTYLVAAGAAGVTGQVVGVGSYGVVGNGGSYGVYGSSGGYGVYGINTSAGGTGAGVSGYGTGTSPGVQGDSQSGWGGSFSSLYVTPGTAYFASGANMGFGNLLLANLGSAPSGSNGAMYYDTGLSSFRCYSGGAWNSCGVGGSGTATYIPKFTAPGTLGNSAMTDNGTTINSSLPIYANGTLTALNGTAVGGSGAVTGQATGAGIVYGVQGYTTGTTDVNSAGVRGSGQNGVFGYSNVASGVGVKGQAFTSAPTAFSASVGTSVGAANTSAYLAQNTATTGGTNWGLNASVSGVNAGSNVAAYLNASNGASNYSLITYLGYVGLGEQTPLNPVVIGTDGSAALPALSIGSGDDSNTGFFRPNADTIAMSTNGLERMRISSAGNVGIGMTTPSYPLDVQGTTTYAGHFSTNSGAVQVYNGYGQTAIYANSGLANATDNIGMLTIVSGSTSHNYGVYSSAGGVNAYSFYGQSGDAYFAGNVGIGTDTPYEKLHVAGSALFDTSIAIGPNGPWANYGVVSQASESAGHFFNSLYPSVYGSLGYAYSGNRYGVYGSAIDSTGTTKYAGYFTSGGSGTNYGVYANGSTYGVYANGTSYGVRTVGTSYGVYSTGTYAGYFGGTGGAYAYAGYDSNYGIYASAPGGGYGVFSWNGGTGYGLYGHGGYYGVYGEGAVRGGDFYDTSGTAHTFIAGASWGVEIITGGAVKPGGGSWSAPSDARTKTDVSDFKDGLSVVRKLRPVNYTYNGLGETPKGMKSIGFIAQEVEPVAPYLVQHQQKKLHPEDIDMTDMLVVDPSAVPIITLNAVKELDLRIDGFEAKIERIDEIDAKVKALERRVEQLEGELDTLREER